MHSSNACGVAPDFHTHVWCILHFNKQRQSILSLNKPIEANVLVVEGWLPDYAVVLTMQEFKKGNYSKIITTGGPLEQGEYLSEYKTYAQLSAATYRKLGLDSNAIVAVRRRRSEKTGPLPRPVT